MNTTDEGFSFSFHKNYKLGPTYPRLAIFSLRELNQTSPLVCFEGWNKFSVPIWSPWEPNLTHRRSGCQLSLLSINFDFRNVIFQPMVFPFVWAKYKWKFVRDRYKLSFPLPLARAFSRDSFHWPKYRRACSQGKQVRDFQHTKFFKLRKFRLRYSYKIYIVILK